MANGTANRPNRLEKKPGVSICSPLGAPQQHDRYQVAKAHY